MCDNCTCTPDKTKITVDTDIWAKLCNDQHILRALNIAGVEKWEGYEPAIKELEDAMKDECDDETISYENMVLIDRDHEMDMWASWITLRAMEDAGIEEWEGYAGVMERLQAEWGCTDEDANEETDEV